ncbi:serine protease inhibitor isoform X2 [Nilaparvata lugens]|uniref:serine protease inhibitor isoform X2 n=1 Tax=Nilaparvata lugens TaxID=108931 RepID=UPI00193D7E63|nr:serine protease inhibitor isoform X2 [Nilaparvata lugens]
MGSAFVTTCTGFFVILITLSYSSSSHSNRVGLVSQSNNAVALKIYEALSSKNNKNILISPISLNYALTALTIGTEGQSYDELTNALNTPKDSDRLKKAYKDFTRNLSHDRNLTIATKFFIDNEFQVKDAYRQDISRYFGSTIGKSDFKHNPEPSRLEINRWVEDNTNNRIKDMLPSGSVDSNTVAFIVNAVHFKSDWLYPFDKALTRSGPFHGLDRKTDTQMMTVTAHFDYKSDDGLGVDIVSLPYKGDYTMLLLVPREKRGITDVEKRLVQLRLNSNASLIDTLMTGMYKREIELTMPKFTLDVKTDMKDVLKEIGVRSIFHQGGLTKISDNPGLVVGDVIQKAYINVDETSTEAAAATAVQIGFYSLNNGAHVLKVDHPFLFQIVHTHSRMSVFSGRIIVLE